MPRTPRTQGFDTAEVLRALSQAPQGRLAFRDLADACAVPAAQRSRFRKFLRTLLRDGVLLQAKGRGYRPGRRRPPSDQGAVEGRITRHRDGFGFLVPDRGDGDEKTEDLFLPHREMEALFDGDRVRAVPVPGRYGKAAGRVVEVVARGRTSVTGTYESVGVRERVIPDPELFGSPIELVPGAVQPRPGEIVEVEIRDYPDGRQPAVGRIVEILGAPGELGTLVETVIRRHGLGRRFPDDALEQAEHLPQALDEAAWEGRRDLRDEPIFTIDGADARDFDDAVAVFARPDGGWRLRVSIADVAHWIPRGSPLDEEAFERGTSTYFPDRVLPMLPEKLSNGLASLRPDEDRLTLTAEMDFDADGSRTRTEVFESVIRSHGRWTYDEVARALAGEDVPGVSAHADHLGRMKALLDRLRERRLDRGALDFDLPEPRIVLGSGGQPEDILRSERNDAHRLIEEFMIAANEAVADWFVRDRANTIFRVHAPPDPEKLRQFVEFARSWGEVPEFGGLASSRVLAEFLEGVRGVPAERAIQHILLRTMMRAQYSEENIGHFGLASEKYLHFTSPIRRYPDLIVHRLAKARLHRRPPPHDRSELRRIAEQSTQRETRSAGCEYDVLDVMRAFYLADRVGEEFDGVISGVIEDGFFVELLDVFVEGMVRIQALDDDWYHFVPEARILVGRRNHRRFAIGDPVRVSVEAVHVALGRTEFRLVRGGSRTAGRVAASGARGAKPQGRRPGAGGRSRHPGRGRKRSRGR